MARGKALHPWILHAALEGLELQKQRADQYIAELRRLLGSRTRKRVAAAAKPRRKLSAAARKRIAAAQKKRWADWRKQRAAAAKK